MTEILRSLPRGPLLFIIVTTLLLVIDDLMPALPFLDTELVAMVLCFAIGAAAILPLTRVALNRERIYRMAPRALAAALMICTSVAVALVAAEFLTRWLYRDVTTTGDDRGFFTRRWIREDHFALNSIRQRDREHSADKPGGVFRVAVVGDSFTYGNGLNVADRFSDLIQRDLPPNFEVMNFGDPGHNTPEHVKTIREKVLQFHPDYILVQWFINDVEGSDPVGRPVYRPLLPWRSMHERLYESSALYTIANSWWTRVQANWFVGSYADYLVQRYGDPNSDGGKRDIQAMTDLIQTCRQARVELGIVLFPDTGFDLGEKYPFAVFHKRVTDRCAAEGLTCIDLRPEFSAVRDRSTLWVNPLDHHPSARANAMAATRILRQFGPAWGVRAAS